MQQKIFEKEIAYKRDPKVKEVLDLGQNMYFSLDFKEFLKADGRIAKISLSKFPLVIL